MIHSGSIVQIVHIPKNYRWLIQTQPGDTISSIILGRSLIHSSILNCSFRHNLYSILGCSLRHLSILDYSFRYTLAFWIARSDIS